MNQKKMTLAMAAIVATVAITATAFAIPQQQAFAWGHHNHHNNTIKVDQQINQANFCSNSICANDANNDVDVHR
jgi:hypothetical protein